MNATPADATASPRGLHLRWGWWSLLFFSGLGFVLESLHGLKVGWYLDAGEETRRLMFTLGHAHGTLLALVHFAFACTIEAMPRLPGDASWALRAATLLMPAGFCIGGLVIYEGDPNLGVLLVPVGGLALLWACGRVALELGRN